MKQLNIPSLLVLKWCFGISKGGLGSGAIHTERVFPFQCATFPLFFYVNALDRRDRYARVSCLLQRLAQDRSAAFLRRSVKLKEVQLLHPVPLINVSSKAVDQSEELGGGASVASFCLQ